MVLAFAQPTALLATTAPTFGLMPATGFDIGGHSKGLLETTDFGRERPLCVSPRKCQLFPSAVESGLTEASAKAVVGIRCLGRHFASENQRPRAVLRSDYLRDLA